MKRSRIIALALALAMVLGTAALAAGTKTDAAIYTGYGLSVNGQKVTPVNAKGEEVELFNYNDSVYAPIRYLSELLGLKIDWNGETNTVLVEGDVVDSAVKPAYTAGTYTGTAMGFGGPIVVEATVSADAITAVKVTGDKETPDVGGAALSRLGYLARTQGLDFDAVTGATYTSRGVKDALGVALDKAQGKTFGEAKDGKYTKVVAGHEGSITVSIMMVGGKLSKVTINSQDETEGVGTYAVDRIPGRILAAQSVNVDAVGGATVSSTTIKQAVTEGLIAAGADVTAWITAPEKAPVVPEDVAEEVDVVIAGAGTAGLMAAARLLEAGVKNVILFEKQDIPGGSMPLAFGGLNGSDSETYKKWLMDRTPTMATGLYMSAWDNIAGTLLMGGKANGSFHGDESLPWLKQLYQVGGAMYDWLNSIGMGFMPLGVEPALATSPYLAPGCYSGGCGYLMEFLVDRIGAQGGKIIYNTEVTELIQAADGTITGVKAVGKDGKNWTVTAKQTMLATGSFAKNEEMLAKYHPEKVGQNFNCPESLTGDGLRMGLEAGAALFQPGSYMPYFLASYNSGYELAFIHYMKAGILVNVKGEEFADITKNNHATMAAAKADANNGDVFYFVFDDAGAATIRDYDDRGMSYKAIFEKGEAVHYNSVEEAAKALNLPNLAATVEANNGYALAGTVNAFGMAGTPYLDTTDGIWLIRVDPNPYLTTVGLEVTIDGQVVDTEGETIPGLWAAGDVIGSYEARETRYGNGFDAGVVFGSIVGDRIAAALSK